jgi:predicted O-methyltransferase YrrM
MYKFTQNWFSGRPGVFQSLIKPNLPNNKEFLEVGCFEGLSTVYTIEHMLGEGGSITCIDSWNEQQMHVEAEKNFDWNTSKVLDKFPSKYLWKLKTKSTRGLAIAICSDLKLDFAFIDGSHYAADVMADACMAWSMLKKGGIMALDDYTWEDKDICPKGPKDGVDGFLKAFEYELRIMYKEEAVIVQKVL